MNIFLDMDDVVADWMAHAKNVLNMDWAPGERIPQEDWDRLKQDERFYLELPLKTGGVDLVLYCLELTKRTGGTLQFLSALPHDYSMPYAAQDKVWWANRYFPGVPVFLGPFSHDKWRHCKLPTDVLIDDRSSNCDEWTSAGGLAHVYRDWPTCKIWFDGVST